MRSGGAVRTACGLAGTITAGVAIGFCVFYAAGLYFLFQRAAQAMEELEWK